MPSLQSALQHEQKQHFLCIFLFISFHVVGFSTEVNILFAVAFSHCLQLGVFIFILFFFLFEKKSGFYSQLQLVKASLNGEYE